MYKNLLKACAIAIFAMGTVESAEAVEPAEIGDAINKAVSGAQGKMRAKVEAKMKLSVGNQVQEIEWFNPDLSIAPFERRSIKVELEANSGAEYKILATTSDPGKLKIEDNGGNAKLKLKHKQGDYWVEADLIAKGSLGSKKFKFDEGKGSIDIDTFASDRDTAFHLEVSPKALERTDRLGEYEDTTLIFNIVAK